MRQEIAAIIALVAIVMTVFLAMRDDTRASVSFEPRITGQVIAERALTPATLVLASGFVKPLSTLTLEENGVRLEGGGFLEAISVDLAGTQNENVVFRVQNVANPLVYEPRAGVILPSQRGASGGSYALLSLQDLARLRDEASMQWHVFTAERSDGTMYTTAVRII